jgi:hypothetical protein
MTTNRTLTKGLLLPALLLSTALSIPAPSVAAPSRDGQIYGIEKAQNNNRRWRGWNNNKRYSRYGSGTFRLEGTFIGQQQGCALVQDRNGQVIPLLNNPGDLRTGDRLVMSGRIQNESVCGTAFRVFNMESLNGRAYDDYRDNGRYNDRYYERDRRDPYYNDRYDDRDDRYEERYDDGNDRLISLTGRLDDSGRCPVIRGDNGEYYDLIGDLRDFRDGAKARVIGFRGVRSKCGGQAIDVKEINR